MRIQIYTLVDITKTNARRDSDPRLYAKQSNYNTLLNTATLRTNLELISLESKQGGVANLGFGKKFKGKQSYWVATFQLERESYTVTVDMLNNDFNLVPFISNLDDTVQFNESIFSTFDEEEKNIVFTIIE